MFLPMNTYYVIGSQNRDHFVLGLNFLFSIMHILYVQGCNIWQLFNDCTTLTENLAPDHFQ